MSVTRDFSQHTVAAHYDNSEMLHSLCVHYSSDVASSPSWTIIPTPVNRGKSTLTHGEAHRNRGSPLKPTFCPNGLRFRKPLHAHRRRLLSHAPTPSHWLSLNGALPVGAAFKFRAGSAGRPSGQPEGEPSVPLTLSRDTDCLASDMTMAKPGSKQLPCSVSLHDHSATVTIVSG